MPPRQGWHFLFTFCLPEEFPLFTFRYLPLGRSEYPEFGQAEDIQ